MQRMTDVLSQMLNDPMTRAALSAGGEDSLDPNETSQRNILGERQTVQEENLQQNQNETEGTPNGSVNAPMDVDNEVATTSRYYYHLNRS